MKRPIPLALALLASALPGSPALALADPFANVWTRQPYGRIPVVDRNNVVTYTIKHGQTDADRVRFVLVLGAGTDAGSNVYRKSLYVISDSPKQFTSLGGCFYADYGNYDQYSHALPGEKHVALGAIVSPSPTLRSGDFSILKREMNVLTSLELRKDNFMGGFSTAAVLHDLEYLQGGDVVTITWEREQN